MRKKVFIAIIAISIILATHLLFVAISDTFDISTDDGFGWNADKSFFMDYSTKGNTVLIWYSICFTNNTDEDHYISSPVAGFKSRELKGWAKDGSFLGSFENGKDEYWIKAHSEENITIVFEGEYLGGKVNEKLSPPKSLVFMMGNEETKKLFGN